MATMNRVVILGGHGKIAMLATRQLQAEGYIVDSVIRDERQSSEVQAAGGKPVVLDLESASVEDLKSAICGTVAVVFAAGAGGGNPSRTDAVDYAAATRAMVAAEQAGVQRFVIISYAGAATDVEETPPSDSFYPYAKAKHDADAYLRQTGLNYTILGPAKLVDHPLTGKIQLISEAGEDWPEDKRVTSRANVAAVIKHAILSGAGQRQTLRFYNGDTPLVDAIGPVAAASTSGTT